ncbi:MAG: hypothetical protein IPH53_11860 [Flavobacteriales bacterium]|nr:hypothetical protein [Flavobacteriales bacterium]
MYFPSVAGLNGKVAMASATLVLLPGAISYAEVGTGLHIDKGGSGAEGEIIQQ